MFKINFQSEKKLEQNLKVNYYEVPKKVNISSTTHYLNERQSIVQFFSSDVSWEKKLNSIEYFFSCLFPSGGLYFKGDVCIERFLEAMRFALQDFSFLFCRFHKNEHSLYASYITDEAEKNFVQLEIEKADQSIDNFIHILPNKVDDRIRNGATEHLDGLPMGIFKLTILKDGFILGYYFNHAFFDQASIVYFFKYVSQLYSYGAQKVLLKKPKFIDLDSVDTSQYVDLNDIMNLRNKAMSLMGFRYTPLRNDESKFDRMSTVDIFFNIENVNKIKNVAGQYISSNDIMHAILFKIYSIDPSLRPDNYFDLGFPCNMRKRCNLGAEAIGNVVGHDRIVVKIDYIKSNSILNLAILNRNLISRIKTEDFKENLNWYKNFQKHHETPLHYMPTFNSLNCRVTNWATFDYYNIRFDNSFPIKLEAPCYAPFGVNVISFDNQNEKQTLKTSLCISSDCLSSVQELGNSTGLFFCKKRI